MSKTALFIFTDGLEELEAIAPLDILRRAGVSCTSASQSNQTEVLGKNGIRLLADCLLSDLKTIDFDLLVIPGGPGVKALRADPGIVRIIQNHAASGKPVAAICAAPTLLNDAGLLENKSYTAHFSVANELPNILEQETVVIDGSIITSRGAGTAIEFGLSLAELLTDSSAAQAVSDSIHFKPA